MKTTFKLRKTTFHVGDHVKTLKGDRMRDNQFKGRIVKFTQWRDYPAAAVKRDKTSDNCEKYWNLSTTCLLKNLIIL